MGRTSIGIDARDGSNGNGKRPRRDATSEREAKKIQRTKLVGRHGKVQTWFGWSAAFCAAIFTSPYYPAPLTSALLQKRNNFEAECHYYAGNWAAPISICEESSLAIAIVLPVVILYIGVG